MHILIVNPYRYEKPSKDKEKLFRKTQLWEEEDLRDYGTYPLEVPYFGGILRKSGHTVKFVDAHQYRIRADALDFSNFDCIIVGTAPYGNWRCAQFSYIHAVEVLKEARNAGSKTIIYGPHATVSPETFLDFADCIIQGEPEGNIIYALSSNKRKLDVNDASVPQSLDEWMPLAFDLIDFDSGYYDAKYIFEGKVIGRLGNISGTRGCPYPCSFCFKVMISEKMRFHTPGNVVEMARELVDKYECKALNFNDLTFTLNKKWVMEVCKGLNGIGVPYSCATRCDCVDSDIAKALADSGCYKIDLGVESASNSVLAAIKKGYSWEDSLKAIELCRVKGIPMVKVFQIFFAPGETPTTVKKTYRKLKDAGLDITPVICTPYPGTEIWNDAIKEGKIPADLIGWDEMVESIAKNAGTIGNSFNRDELEIVLKNESSGIKEIFNKTINEYNKDGIRGIIRKGLKKIK